MIINYKGKEYEIKFTYRALMIYENITNTTFQPTNFTGIINYFYSALLATAKGELIDYEEFIDWLDENPEELNKFSMFLDDIYNMNNKISPKPDKDKDIDDTELPN